MRRWFGAVLLVYLIYGGWAAWRSQVTSSFFEAIKKRDTATALSYLKSHPWLARRTRVVVEQTGSDSVSFDTGNCAIHLAVREGLQELVRALLERGADPNERDSRANTPLHLCVRADRAGSAEARLSMARLLLDAGGDPTLRNRMRKRPSDLVPPKNPELKLLLEQSPCVQVRPTPVKGVFLEDYVQEVGFGLVMAWILVCSVQGLRLERELRQGAVSLRAQAQELGADAELQPVAAAMGEMAQALESCSGSLGTSFRLQPEPIETIARKTRGLSLYHLAGCLIVSLAAALIRIDSEARVLQVLAMATFGPAAIFLLGSLFTLPAWLYYGICYVVRRRRRAL